MRLSQAIKSTACLVHHGDTGACARAMSDPKRAFLFSTLRARVKRIKNKLTGRMLFSEVAAVLNRPLTATEARGSQIKPTDTLLIPLQFLHDLRLIYAFEEPTIRVRNNRTNKRERVAMFPTMLEL